MRQWYTIKSYQLLALWLAIPIKAIAIQNPEVIEEYQSERIEKKSQFIEYMKYLNKTDSIENFIREIYDDEYLT